MLVVKATSPVLLTAPADVVVSVAAGVVGIADEIVAVTGASLAVAPSLKTTGATAESAAEDKAAAEEAEEEDGEALAAASADPALETVMEEFPLPERPSVATIW